MITAEQKAEILARVKARHKEIAQRVKQKCLGCGKVKPLSEFGSHSLSEGGGAQSYCKECKNGMQKHTRETDVIFRMRHHMLTRIHYQLGDKCPKDMDSNLPKYLGYRLTELKVHLMEQVKKDFGITLLESFSEGYHVDHVVPLHSFDGRIARDPSLKDAAALQAFRECWHFTNLRSIPAQDNLAKGGKLL